jgi:hypothetical protein
MFGGSAEQTVQKKDFDEKASVSAVNETIAKHAFNARAVAAKRAGRWVDFRLRDGSCRPLKRDIPQSSECLARYAKGRRMTSKADICQMI